MLGRVLLLILARGIVSQSPSLCDQDVCEYFFEVKKTLTMTMYNIIGDYPRNFGVRVFERENGDLFYVNNPGMNDPNREEVTLEYTDFDTGALNILDGYYRMVSSVNDQVPGPTIEVYQDTTVIVHVHNADAGGKAISVHWHGMFQVGTPWMDGIGGVTQCHIAPATSYTYVFTANPWGTFWYHEHTGFERTDGLYGALIVHERDEPHALLYDHDFFFTTVNDWYHEDTRETHLAHDVGIYNDRYERFVPEPRMPGGFTRTTSEIPFVGGLFNNMGQHFTGNNVLYRRFYQYDVVTGQRYRMRFIHTGSLFAIRVSIDSHPMTLLSADGFDVETVMNLESIILYPGERLDVAISAVNPVTNYWVRGGTLEEDPDFRHEFRAVLHYSGAPDPHVVPPVSLPKECSAVDPCRMSPCMWSRFPPQYNIQCIHTASWRLLSNYPDRRILQADGSFEDIYGEYPNGVPLEADETIFINLGVPYKADGFTYLSNSHPPLFSGYELEHPCPTDANGAPYCPTNDCLCTYIRELDLGSVVDFVWYNFKSTDPPAATLTVHATHIHGHAPWVIAEGLNEYDADTNTYNFTSNIHCDGLCVAADWAPGMAPEYNLVNPPRRDTYSIGPGSFVVLRTVMDNPGTWAVHCHLETHTTSMMVLYRVMHNGDPNEPTNFDANRPEGWPTCGNFNPMAELAKKGKLGKTKKT